MSDVLTLIATNLIVILYTTLALRLARFDEFPPNKNLYKVSVWTQTCLYLVPCALQLTRIESAGGEGGHTEYVYVGAHVV